MPPLIGVVVIGRNEGERLRRCLASVVGQAEAVVYVDSGSTDGSVALALAIGVEVVALDMSQPFTAARARNTGFGRLLELMPNLEFVQFLDGDCELFPGWLPVAREMFQHRNDLAAVAGRLRERFPEQSVYNRLAEFEWNIQGYGDVSSVGGIFMVRRRAFVSMGGFNPAIPSGEEPEFCQRLRKAGWYIGRIETDMAWHDLAMLRLGQWFKRQLRNGYGMLNVVSRFGMAEFKRNVMRSIFWSVWPILVALLGLAVNEIAGMRAGWLAAALVFGLWPIQLSRIALKTLRQGHAATVALPYAFFTMLSYWPQMIGQIYCILDRFRRHEARLVEYK